MITNHLTKLKQSSTNAVFIALVLIGAIALYGWLVAPHVAYLKAVQKYEPILDSVVKEKHQLQKLLATRRRLLQDWNTKFDQMSRVLFTEEQARALFKDLETYAEQYQCAIDTVDRSADQPVIVVGQEGDVTQVEARQSALSLVGPYAGFLGFIQFLQAYPHRIAIKALDISTLQSDREARNLRCHVSIEIYVLKESEG